MTLEEKLDVYCYAYYVKCNPLVSDYEFDMLERKLGEGNTARFRGNESEDAYPQKVKDDYELLRQP